ncbi:MAG: T9SS type A sorting domain-containing protein [Ignavibacteriae bacterium]|nr:T9SS type A sorting domain-containing protein [Ignavibacteriota bacterium]
MKRILTSLFAFALLLVLLQGNANAQLTGTKTIPGTYATIAAAIADLNAQGVGAGGVTFNISPGYTETVPSGGLIINITSNQPTSGNPVVFQRNGAGANPVIQTDGAGSGTVAGTALGSNGDAIIKLVGVDYVTFNNINFTENYTGGTQTLRTEYGILMVRSSSTDGCKNITISGCTFQQQQSDIYSSCIATTNFNAAGTTTNPTDINGRHENISVQGCTLNNSVNGMYFQGYNHASAPYDFYENGYSIGNVTGNTLTNIGTGLAGTTTAIQYGIYSQYVDSIKVNNNTIRINSGLNNAQNYGILLSTAVNGFVDVINNNVCDTMISTTTSQQAAIWVSAGSSGTNNVVNIQNNVVANCRHIGATSGAAVYIGLGSAPYTMTMSGNVVRDNTMGGGGTATATGTMYGLYSSSSLNSNAGSSHTINNNNVENLTRTQSAAGSGTQYGIYVSNGGLITNIHNNTVDSLYNGTTTGALYGMAPVIGVTGGTLSTYNNTVSNLFKMPGATTGSIYGIYQNNSSATSNCYNNDIYNLTNFATASTGGAMYGYYNFGVGTLVENIYNNTIHDITHMGTTVASSLGCNGIYAASGPSTGLDKNVYGNTIYNISVGYGQVGGMQVNYALTANIYGNKLYNIAGTNNNLTPQTYGVILGNSTAGSVYNVYNNFVQEIKAPNCPNYPGAIGIWANAGATSVTNFMYNTIYLDATSAGANFGSIALYAGGVSGATVENRNNIIINKSVANGTGGSLAIYKPATTTLGTGTNNNNIYVTPGASNFLYYDGTTLYSDLASYKTAVAPRESNAVTDNTPFINTSSSPYDLHVSTTIPTWCEASGTPITTPIAVTTDFDGNTRNASTPDIGADEFDGVKFPDAPNLVSPSNNATGLPPSVNLIWNRPVSSFSYRVDVATDNSFTNIIATDSTSDSSKAVSGLTAGTQYYWRVKAYNVLGEGPYSNVWNFTIAAAPTTAPVLVYPSNGAVLVEVNPNMDWNSVPDATNYQIQISTDPGFSTIVVDTDTLTGTELQLGNNFLSVNTHYYWRVRGKSIGGDGPYSAEWDFTTGVTNIDPLANVPTVYELYQNYPNPFNPTTKIKFDIPQPGFVTLKVYDITGKEVATLVNSNLEPARYEVNWNGTQFASGVYFFRINAGDFVKVQKMILVK